MPETARNTGEDERAAADVVDHESHQRHEPVFLHRLDTERNVGWMKADGAGSEARSQSGQKRWPASGVLFTFPMSMQPLNPMPCTCRIPPPPRGIVESSVAGR
jgi:hypothetical protein